MIPQNLTNRRLRCCPANRDLEGPLDVREQLWEVRHPVHTAYMRISVPSARLLNGKLLSKCSTQVYTLLLLRVPWCWAQLICSSHTMHSQHDKPSAQLLNDAATPMIPAGREALHWVSLRASREISPIMHMPRNVSLG